MPLKVLAGRLDLWPTSIIFELHDGNAGVLCMIPRRVLRDLGGYHQLTGSDEAMFSELLPEIERIASMKFDAGRIDDDGNISIGTADLLRYGALH